MLSMSLRITKLMKEGSCNNPFYFVFQEKWFNDDLSNEKYRVVGEPHLEGDNWIVPVEILDEV